MDKFCGGDIDPPLSVAVTENEELPAVVGVPVIAPVVENDSPDGKLPEEIAKV